MAELHHLPYLDNLYWNDAWDGYPLARQRLLTKMVDSRLENPIVLTGDWHSAFARLQRSDERRRRHPLRTLLATSWPL